MTLTTDLLKEWYNKFNQEFFNSELPTYNIDLCVSKTKRVLGSCQMRLFGEKTIKVSNYYIRTEIEYQTTLIHEMIHLYEAIKFGVMSHGKFFKDMSRQIHIKSNGLYSIKRVSNIKYEVNDECCKSINQPIVLFQDSYGINSAIYPTKSLLNSVIDFIKGRPYLKIIGYGYISSQKYIYGGICRSRFRYYHISNINEIISHLKENRTFVNLYA